MVLSPADDRRWLSLAIELSQQCPPSTSAFSVGAIVVDASGVEVARGFSRERPHVHAEEVALQKPGAERVHTLYSSLEPCTRRMSSHRTCAELIIAAQVPRVVIAWREPPTFVDDAHGVAALEAAGIEVVEYPELASAAEAVNAALLTSTDG